MNTQTTIDIGSARLARPPIVPEIVHLPKARSLRRALYAACVVFALGGAAAWWFSGSQTSIHYVTAQATTGRVTRVVSGSGTVNPVLTIIVGTYVSGVIQNISCDFNTKVRKGQLCAKIDPSPYQTQVDQAEANLATAKAQLVKDQANLTYTQSVFERDTKLLVIGGVSQETADVARNAYEQAKAQIVLDQATIQQRDGALTAAKVNLGYTNIISPVDGTVVSRNVTVGQTVAASFQTPTLFLIATDLTKMQVDTNVSESDIGSVKLGDSASFTVEAWPEKIFHGTVTQVRQAPQTVQNVVTYDVVIAVENEQALLRPGMTATTRIVTASRDKVLRVPDQALRFSPAGTATSGAANSNLAAGESRVWLLRDGQPQPVTVKLGLDDDAYTEITGGMLKAGDAVIVGSQSNASSSNNTAPTARPRMFGF